MSVVYNPAPMQIKFEKDLPVIDDLQSIFLNNTPLLDVRAPVEFSQGAFEMAHNLPLLSDEERQQIGIKYKKEGQDKAIQLAAKLINADIRANRVTDWEHYISQNPHSVLYCFRGGMRSKVAQQWIYEKTGLKYPRVQGGYKALRRFLIDNSERLIQSTSFILLGGSTGSGKTRLLTKIPQSIDLEGLANHRGSAFGANATPQPTQINFENTLSIQQLKLEQGKYQPLLLEDEGRNIGGIHLPKTLCEKMNISPVIMLQISAQERLETSMQEYAVDMLHDFQNQHGEEAGFSYFKKALLDSLDRIQKRLGGERHQRIRKLAEQALHAHQKTGQTEAHTPWVSELLTDYYDPMYHYQIEQKKERIVFTGNHREILEYIEKINSIKP